MNQVMMTTNQLQAIANMPFGKVLQGEASPSMASFEQLLLGLALQPSSQNQYVSIANNLEGILAELQKILAELGVDNLNTFDAELMELDPEQTLIDLGDASLFAQLLPELKAFLHEIAIKPDAVRSVEQLIQTLEENYPKLFQMLDQYAAIADEKFFAIPDKGFTQNLHSAEGVLQSDRSKQFLANLYSLIQTLKKQDISLSKVEIKGLSHVLKLFKEEIGVEQVKPSVAQMVPLQKPIRSLHVLNEQGTEIKIVREQVATPVFQKDGLLTDTGETIRIGYHQLLGNRPVQANSALQHNGTPSYTAHAETLQKDLSQFLVKQIQMTRFPNGMSEAKLKLFPENLGMIDVKITVKDGVVTAQFTAETQAAKELLEGNLSTLRNHLSLQGLQIERLEIQQSQHHQNNHDLLNRNGDHQHEGQQHAREQNRDRKESDLDFSEIMSSFNQKV